MKITEKKSGRCIEISMYILSDDNVTASNDIAADFFDGYDIIVDSIDYCKDQVKDWIFANGDFMDEDCHEMRLAIIDGVIDFNYKV